MKLSLLFPRWMATCLVLVLLVGCGFQLRGPRPLPFARLYLDMNPYSELAVALKQQIRASGTTTLSDSPDDADARFQVLAELRDKVVLSVGADGKVREYQLRQRLAFRVVDRHGTELLPPSDIILRRDFTFSDAYILAKEQEELLLHRDMQNDLVQQVLRRLAATPTAPVKP
jgi:LPS-assembly lipoprotein